MILTILYVVVLQLTASEVHETQFITDFISGYSALTPPAASQFFNISTIEQENQHVDFSETVGDADTLMWTFIFYDDAEFPGYNPLEDFANEVHSSASMHVIVLEDTMEDPASLYNISETGEILLLEEWGEVNMGDGQTLLDLINVCKSDYPAERYLLAMYDHGGGWMGACVDETSNDALDMDEIQTAIVGAEGVDILVFTAPCLMGALESAYELRDCVDVYIGSEDLSGYILWRGIMDDICEVLNNSSTLSSQEIGCTIVDLVEYNFQFHSYEDWATMCAVNQEALQGMVTVTDQMVQYMADNIADLAPNVQIARESAWTMGAGVYSVSETDFVDFLEEYLAVEDDPFITGRIGDILPLYSDCILNSCFGPEQERANGLSISFPADESGYSSWYGDCSLDFTDNTSWDEFLEAYYYWQSLGIGEQSFSETISICPARSPAVGSVDILYTVPYSGNVFISVIDVSGRVIESFAVCQMSAGEASLTWNGFDSSGKLVTPGIYFLLIQDAMGNRASASMVLLKGCSPGSSQ